MRSTTTGIIYGLFDPRDGLLRYVGQTTVTLKMRLQGHYSDPKRNRKNNWIKSLRSGGLRPVIKAISEHPIEELDDMEVATIAMVQSAGASLLNATCGGRAGIVYPPYVRKRSAKNSRAGLQRRKRNEKGQERNDHRAIRLLGMYAYHRSWGYAKIADGCLESMERSCGVKYSDPFAQKVMDKLRKNRMVEYGGRPHTVEGTDWKTHKYRYTYGMEREFPAEATPFAP